MFEMPPETGWVWCLVGNVVKSHKYGEEKEVRTGTKQFRPGAKVLMAPPNWGDGYEKAVVIGCPRNSKRYMEAILRSEYVENYRVQKVFAPFILKMMDSSEHLWWDASENSLNRIKTLIDSLKK